MPAAPTVDIPLRIIVDDPLPGVALALQHGREGLDPPTDASARHAVFDFSVRLGKPQAGGTPTFLGAYAQGPAATRFVYVCVGRRAGQADTSWDRRAKVPLGGITSAQVETVLESPHKRLAVRFPGRGSDGGPTCATVRLAPDAWLLVDDGSAE